MEDPFEPVVEIHAGLGRYLLWPAGKLHIGVRRGILPDFVETIHQKTEGFAIIVIVPQQGLLVFFFACLFPSMSPYQALQARRGRIAPSRPDESSQRL